jgi:hypothetical protein
MADRLLIELHWSLGHFRGIGNSGGTAGLFERAVMVKATSIAFRTMHPVDALIFAAVHRTVGHRDEPRLIWTCDIAYIARQLKTNEDWAALQQRIADTTEFQSVRASLEAASDWLGFTPPQAYADFSRWPVPEETSNSILIRDSERRWLSGLVRITRENRSAGFTAKIRFWFRIAFPSPATMRRDYPGLLPFSYARRLTKWITTLSRR